MQKGHQLEFPCQSCDHSINFSIFSLNKNKNILTCSNCQKEYSFGDEILLRQLTKFEKLCVQLQESEEILSNTSVGVDVGNKQVTIPYKLLLTRLNTQLELDIGGTPCTITFRIEPTVDVKQKDHYENLEGVLKK